MVKLTITLAIIGLLGVGAMTAVHQTKVRNSFTSAATGLQVGLRKLKADAWGSGFNTIFVVNKTTGQYWGIEDKSKAFSLTTFSATNPAPAPNVLLFSGSLTSPVAFGPSTGYGTGTLPRPFATGHASNACTFCVTTPNGYGAITFTPEGAATFTGANASDGSFSIQVPNDRGTGYS